MVMLAFGVGNGFRVDTDDVEFGFHSPRPRHAGVLRSQKSIRGPGRLPNPTRLAASFQPLRLLASPLRPPTYPAYQPPGGLRRWLEARRDRPACRSLRPTGP